MEYCKHFVFGQKKNPLYINDCADEDTYIKILKNLSTYAYCDCRVI